MKYIPLVLLSAQTSFAFTSFTISNLTVNDTGNPGNVSLAAGGSTVVTTQGDLNLVDFTVGSDVYSATDFISGIGTNSTINKDTVAGVIQHSTATNDGSLAFGSTSDLSDYLIQGSRGLSFSSALNYATSDPPGTIVFDIEFLSDPTASSRPTFIVGDGADNQSDDLWSFQDADGVELFSITLTSANYSVFGKQTVDRVESDDSGFRTPLNQSDNTDRGLGLAAFSLTNADLNGADWNDVKQLAIRVPETGNDPKTDYAFFGVDTGLITSSGLVVPEPSSTSLLALSSCLLILRRKK
jgi:hypothetical protein